MSQETVYKAQVNKGDRLTISPWLLIAAGVLLLAANLFQINVFLILWPGFIVLPGLLLLWPAHRSTPKHQHSLAFLAVPGAMVVGLGIIFFLLNLTRHMEAISYAWPLVLAAGAVGWRYMNRYDESSAIHRHARPFIRTMVLLTIGLAFIFELLLFQQLPFWWPILFIGFGIFLVVKNRTTV